MLNRLITSLRNNDRAHKIINITLIACLALYIFSIPAFSARAKWNYVSYFLMALCAMMTLLEYIIYEKFFFDRRLLIFVAFVLEALIGTVIFSHDFRHWLTIILVVLSLVIFYYAFSAIKDKRLIYQVIAFAFLAFGAYFAIVYYKRVLTFRISGESLGTYFDNVNAVGTYFSIGSVLFLYLALFNKKKLEYLYIIPALAMLYLGIFTGSRHFLITTFVAAFVAIFLSIKKRKWIALIVLGAAIGLFFIIIQIPALADFRERINRAITTLFGIGNAKIDPSVVQRTLWPRYGFNLGSKELLFGYGVEGFSIYSGIGTYAHNNYAEVLCDFGILGLVIFYSAVLYPFFLAIRSKDKTKYIVIIIITFYLVKGFFGVYYSSKDAYMMLALCFCLVKDIRLGDFKEFNFKIKRDDVTNSYFEVSI